MVTVYDMAVWKLTNAARELVMADNNFNAVSYDGFVYALWSGREPRTGPR
jgi:hypothetical protein